MSMNYNTDFKPNLTFDLTRALGIIYKPHMFMLGSYLAAHVRRDG